MHAGGICICKRSYWYKSTIIVVLVETRFENMEFAGSLGKRRRTRYSWRYQMRLYRQQFSITLSWCSPFKEETLPDMLFLLPRYQRLLSRLMVSKKVYKTTRVGSAEAPKMLLNRVDCIKELEMSKCITYDDVSFLCFAGYECMEDQRIVERRSSSQTGCVLLRRCPRERITGISQRPGIIMQDWRLKRVLEARNWTDWWKLCEDDSKVFSRAWNMNSDNSALFIRESKVKGTKKEFLKPRVLQNGLVYRKGAVWEC